MCGIWSALHSFDRWGECFLTCGGGGVHGRLHVGGCAVAAPGAPRDRATITTGVRLASRRGPRSAVETGCLSRLRLRLVKAGALCASLAVVHRGDVLEYRVDVKYRLLSCSAGSPGEMGVVETLRILGSKAVDVCRASQKIWGMSKISLGQRLSVEERWGFLSVRAPVPLARILSGTGTLNLCHTLGYSDICSPIRPMQVPEETLLLDRGVPTTACRHWTIRIPALHNRRSGVPQTITIDPPPISSESVQTFPTSTPR